MSAIYNYKIDIIKRTSELLDKNFHDFKEKDREATFLINCLLGLIIAVSENEKKKKLIFKGKISDEFIAIIPDKIGFIIDNLNNLDLSEPDLTNIKMEIGHKINLKDCEMFWFIKNLRNGIAHQNILGINENGVWVGVRIWNIYNKKKDFEIIFTIQELRDFALKLASTYLENTHTVSI